MRQFTPSILVLLLILFAVSAQAATQATVTLRNGDTIQGSYAGGDKTTVRVAVKGAIREIAVSEIRSIEFVDRAGQTHKAEAQSESPEAKGPVLPQHTVLAVQLAQPISSAITTEGNPFMAVLAESVEIEGETVLRKGMTVQGRVLESRRGGPSRGDARLVLVLTEIRLPGRQVELITERWVYTKMGRKGAQAADSVSYVTQTGQISIPAGARLEFRLAEPVVIPPVGEK